MTDKDLSERDISEASQLLGVDAKYLQPFCAEDPFNPGVVVLGALSMRPDATYGSLAILEVGGNRCPQLVRCTPKLHYPFDKAGTFRFPPVHDIHIYEKLDGTNVLSYAYRHPDGETLVSHKLRLAPFLRNGKWGEFLDMWKGILSEHPDIPGAVMSTGCNISHELYGSANEHLIKYDERIRASALFGVARAGGHIVPPFASDLDSTGAPDLLGKVSAGEDPVERYRQVREALEKLNAKENGGKIRGTEGAVWYLRGPGGEISLWKCKPESVEEIHWATGINKNSVLATCWNVLESSDALDFARLEPLLLEEYQADDIHKFRSHIDDCIRLVNTEREFREKVNSAYSEIQAEGLDIARDKGAVMRSLSRRFPKDQMTKVYGVIAR